MKKFLLLGLFSVFSLMASANLYLNLYFVLESDLSTPIWFHQMGWVTSKDVNFTFTSGYFPFDDEVIPKYKPVRWVDGYEWHDLAARTFSYTEDQNKNFYLVVELIEYSVTLDVDATMGTASLDKPSGKYAVDSTFLATAAANPGYRFKCVEALVTTFHLPESTLIMLVSALAGRESVLNAYRCAVEERYRFFSFGDAMFIH